MDHSVLTILQNSAGNPVVAVYQALYVPGDNTSEYSGTSDSGPSLRNRDTV